MKLGGNDAQNRFEVPPKKVSYQSATSHSYLFLGRVQITAGILHRLLHEAPPSVNKMETTRAKSREARNKIQCSVAVRSESVQGTAQANITSDTEQYITTQTNIFMSDLTGYG
jgi:hypothetical protein